MCPGKEKEKRRQPLSFWSEVPYTVITAGHFLTDPVCVHGHVCACVCLCVLVCACVPMWVCVRVCERVAVVRSVSNWGSPHFQLNLPKEYWETVFGRSPSDGENAFIVSPRHIRWGFLGHSRRVQMSGTKKGDESPLQTHSWKMCLVFINYFKQGRKQRQYLSFNSLF